MTKSEMIKKVAEVADVNQKDVENILSAYSNVVINTLKENHEEKLTLHNLGTFKVKEVGERRGVSAINGGEWFKPSHSEIVFKPVKSVKDI